MKEIIVAGGFILWDIDPDYPDSMLHPKYIADCTRDK